MLSSFKDAPWYHKTYILDMFIGLLCYIFAFGVFNGAVEPFNRYLPDPDPSVTYPKKDDSVPVWLLGLIDLVPVMIFIVFQYFKRSLHDAHHSILAYFLALGITSLVTNVFKTYAGRYRPDWLSTFEPTNSPDGRFSFPSGHASNSFAAMTFLSLYLAGKLNICNNKVTTKSFAVILAVYSPLLISTFIAVSRTRDYKHDFSDIIAGSLIGVFASYTCYFAYYPSLSVTESDIPKSQPYVVEDEQRRSLSRSNVDIV